MAITCNLRGEGIVEVNGKELYKDINGNWVKSNKTQDLNVAEAKTLQLFISACERYGFQSARVTWPATPKDPDNGD